MNTEKFAEKLSDIFKEEAIKHEILICQYRIRCSFFKYGKKEIPGSIIEFPVLDNSTGLVRCSTGVDRVAGTYSINGNNYNLYQVFLFMFLRKPSSLYKELPYRPLLQPIKNGIRFNAIHSNFYRVQQAINFMVSRLPLRSTDYRDWAMNNRVEFLNPEFNTMKPNEKLDFIVEKNKKFFPWSSIGLSASNLAEPFISKLDLREITPFGNNYHNVARSLYQTLKMQGDGFAKIKTTKEKELEEKGINRTGWNLETAFIDLPGNYLDQIIVNKRLSYLSIKEYKTYNVWGLPLVKEGDVIDNKTPLSQEPGDINKLADVEAEKIYVDKIEKKITSVSGKDSVLYEITIAMIKKLKNGTKFINRHGNKGIIWLTDTGTYINSQGKEVPIDVIVNASSIRKRKNYGQLYEAVVNNIMGDKKNNVCIEVEQKINLDRLKYRCKDKHINNDDLTSKVSTRWGEFNAVCGKVFWGVTKNPEIDCWTRKEITAVDNKKFRTSGIKLSHIELSALVTMFGPKNSVVGEILQHQQGKAYLEELIKISDSIKGIYPNVLSINANLLNPISQKEGFLHKEEEFKDTIYTQYQTGFILELPFNIRLQSIKADKKQVFLATEAEGVQKKVDTNEVVLDRVYIPSVQARKIWRHPSGLYGMEELLLSINNLSRMLKQYKNGKSNKKQVVSTLKNYLMCANSLLSGKRGEINKLGISVRYPYSTKATAVLGENLPTNTIRIHIRMAKLLNVKKGDVVLVERFPCLGFLSLRPQYVEITKDDAYKYVIQVSGNSLNSLNLDFDGDIIYLMSFKQKKSNDMLRNYLVEPASEIREAIEESLQSNSPQTKSLNINDYGIELSKEYDKESNGKIIKQLASMKLNIGVLVGTCYHVMRIIERNISARDQNIRCCLERILDKTANSVFDIKHTGEAIDSLVLAALQKADYKSMVKLGFNPKGSEILCNILKKEKSKLSTSRPQLLDIIEAQHKLWFISRKKVTPIFTANYIHTKPSDIPGFVFYKHLRK